MEWELSGSPKKVLNIFFADDTESAMFDLIKGI
jgi:hypothetical protein